VVREGLLPFEDDVRRICTFADRDLTTPLETDGFNVACSTFVHQAADLGCFK